LAAAWGRLGAKITRRILVEDMGLYADIQRGLAASPHAGVLGRCEERIHAFQRYLVELCDPGRAPAERQELGASTDHENRTDGAPSAQADAPPDSPPYAPPQDDCCSALRRGSFDVLKAP
jgi:hypothetical protein